MDDSNFSVVPTVGQELDSSSGRIIQIAWSPQGLLLAASTEAGRILIWRKGDDGYSLQAQADLSGQGRAKPWCIAWSPVGTALFSGWSDGFIRELKADNLKLISEVRASNEPIVSIAPKAKGSTLAAIARGDDKISLWNTGGKKLQLYAELTGHEKSINNIVWNTQGEDLASCSADGTIRLWHYDSNSGHTAQYHEIKSYAQQVVWAPSRTPLLAGIEDGGRVRLWQTRRSSSVTLPHQGSVSSVAFSPDGSLCATRSSDGMMRLWESATGQIVAILEDHGPIKLQVPALPLRAEMAFQPLRPRSTPSTASEQLIFASLNEAGNRIRFWSLQRAQRAKADNITSQFIPRLPPQLGPIPQPPPPPPPSKESIQRSGVQDQPTDTDYLGFEPYVQAVADFLIDPRTESPLTVSVEGEWGTGKSSFMRQVGSRIREFPDKRSRLLRILQGPRHVTISFNAWRHDKEEAVWAAFAIELIRQLRQQCGLYRRQLGWLKLSIWRLRWISGFASMLRFVGWLVVLIFLIGVIYNPRFTNIKQATGSASPASAASGNISKPFDLTSYLGDLRSYPAHMMIFVFSIVLLLNAKKLLGNPLDLEIGKYFRSATWNERVAFIERFHSEFSKVIRSYSESCRVYVFIDDLDRCDVPRAADLMQAINMLISDDSQVFFILGMDRRKVAAGLAVKYENIFSHLSDAASSEERPEKIEYGYQFIEKFVQIPFQLPRPASRDIERLLRTLARSETTFEVPSVPPTSMGSQRRNKGPIVDPGEPPKTDAAEIAPPISPEQFSLELNADSETFLETVLLVAPTLDYNPRRIKHFVNLLRLRAYIAYRTGLLAGREARPGMFTFFQLGKMVAISLRWPLLVADLEGRPTLLNKLEAAALGTEQGLALTAKESYWVTRPKLVELLRAGATSPEYRLASLNVEMLLTVSPSTKRS